MHNPWVFRAIHSLLLIALFPPVISSAIAQTTGTPAEETEAMVTLPDAPGMSSTPPDFTPASSSSSIDFSPFTETRYDPARVRKYVPPGEHPGPLSPGDKVLLGLRGATYPIPALGWLVSATFSQGLDRSPNYGRDTKAFFQRLGAAAARNSSEGIISDSIMATALHEDPRYYKLGKGNSFVHRLENAVEHVVLTRTDDGQQTINYALLSGNLAGSALTNAYYPDRNRGLRPTMTTFAWSLGGSALGFTVAEFYSDAMEMLHGK